MAPILRYAFPEFPETLKYSHTHLPLQPSFSPHGKYLFSKMSIAELWSRGDLCNKQRLGIEEANSPKLLEGHGPVPRAVKESSPLHQPRREMWPSECFFSLLGNNLFANNSSPNCSLTWNLQLRIDMSCCGRRTAALASPVKSRLHTCHTGTWAPVHPHSSCPDGKKLRRMIKKRMRMNENEWEWEWERMRMRMRMRRAHRVGRTHLLTPPSCPPLATREAGGPGSSLQKDTLGQDYVSLVNLCQHSFWLLENTCDFAIVLWRELLWGCTLPAKRSQ